MIYAELQQDTLAWQRALKFAGMYRGKLDGLTGPLTREAAAQWRESHKQLQTRYGRLDKRTEDNLLTLQPLAALKVRQMMTALRALGDWRLICGLRTYDEQDKLYAKRPRVTNARGGQSMHNFGVAADVCLFRDGVDIWAWYGAEPGAPPTIQDTSSWASCPRPPSITLTPPGPPRWPNCSDHDHPTHSRRRRRRISGGCRRHHRGRLGSLRRLVC